ncbi:MAG: hypothetical protein AAGC71_13820 [Pseudomonadota bacterium]
MLLRRITKHVKDQNWFAVGIDFVIVVIGVFIGIQVANWNDARTNKADLLNSLQRLDKEVVQNISLIDDVVEKYDDGAADRAFGRGALNNCDISAESQAALEALLFDLVADVQPNFNTAALQQLIGETRFQSFLSAKLQQELVIYSSRLQEEYEQLNSHYERMWEHHVIFHPAVDAYFPDSNERSGGNWGFRLIRPFSEVCKDASFRTRFINTIGFYQSIGRRISGLKSELEVFRESLNTEIEMY